MGLSTDNAASQSLQGHSHLLPLWTATAGLKVAGMPLLSVGDTGILEPVESKQLPRLTGGGEGNSAPGLDPWHPPSQSLPVSFLTIPLAKSSPLLILVNKVLLAVSQSCCLSCGLQLFWALPLQEPGDCDRNQMAGRLISII